MYKTQTHKSVMQSKRSRQQFKNQSISIIALCATEFINNIFAIIIEQSAIRVVGSSPQRRMKKKNGRK